MYFACALTGTSDQFQKSMNQWRDEYLAMHFEILKFAWLDGAPDPSVTNIHEHDLNRVESADIIVAMLDNPSFGVGMELQHAIQLKKPVIGFKTEGVAVSRMITDSFKENDYPLLSFQSMSKATHEVLIRTTHRIDKLPFFSFRAAG